LLGAVHASWVARSVVDPFRAGLARQKCEPERDAERREHGERQHDAEHLETRPWTTTAHFSRIMTSKSGNHAFKIVRK